MPWLKNPFQQNRTKEETPSTPEPFHMDITDDDYFSLPWTISWDGGAGWTCMELKVSCTEADDFDALCKAEALLQLSNALEGKAPVLPAGYIWKEGKPIRDPGKVRYLTPFKKYGRNQ